MSNFSNGINNGSNTPVIYQTTDANRPTAPLAVGSLFVSQTSNILQRWDGSGWVTVGGSGTGSVTSVNGQTGVVVLTTTDIAEGTNLYYTDARARAALSAGSGISYNQTTGQITNSGVLSVNGQTGAVTLTTVTSVNGQTGAVTLTTTNISEGTNLYYTDARARAALSAGSGISYNQTTGQIANSGVLSVNGQTGAVTISSAVTSVNGQTGVVVLTTTDISEGTNLYYTDARARAALSAGSGISYNSTTGAISNGGVLSFNGNTGAITYTAPVTSVNSQTGAVTLTTTNIAEGTNLYYTDGRARAALSGGTGVTYNSTTGTIAIGQSVATSATPVFAGVQANGSSGILINNSAGTLVATFGSAGTTNASIVGGLTVGGTVSATTFSGSGTSLTGVALLSGATFTGAVSAVGFSATGANAGLFTNNTAAGNGYGLIATGASGAARDIFIAGQTGYSNGFTVQYNGTEMVYGMANGNLTVGGSVSASSFTGNGATINGNAIFSTSGTPSIYVNQIYSAGGNSSSSIRINLNGSGGGAYLAGYDGDAQFSWNREFISGSSNVARASNAGYIDFSASGFNIYYNTGLTSGATYTPTSRLYINNTGAATFSSTVQATQFNGVLVSGNSLAGTLTGTGTNVGSQFKFVTDNNTTGAFIGIAAGESTGDAVFAVGANKKLVFGVGSAGTSRAAELSGNSFKIFATAGNAANYVEIGSVAGTANTWLFGSYVTGASVSLSSSQYLNVTINGNAVKLAVVV